MQLRIEDPITAKLVLWEKTRLQQGSDGLYINFSLLSYIADFCQTLIGLTGHCTVERVVEIGLSSTRECSKASDDITEGLWNSHVIFIGTDVLSPTHSLL